MNTKHVLQNVFSTDGIFARLSSNLKELFQYRSLVLRLSFWFIVLSFLPVIILGIIVRNDVRERISAGDIRTSLEVARLASAQFASKSDNAQEALTSFARRTKELVGIINTDGIYVNHSDSARIHTSAYEDFSADVIKKCFSGGDGFVFREGSSHSVAYSAIPSTGLVVIASMNPAFTIHSMSDLEWGFYKILGAALLLVAILAGIIIWLIITIPLRRLTTSARSIREGNYQISVDTSFMQGEMQILASVFNEMAGSIDTAYRKLKENGSLYKGLFEGVPIGLYRTTPGGELLDVNNAMVHMLRYPNREALLAVQSSQIYLTPDHRYQWQERIEKELVVPGHEMPLRCFDGTIIWARETSRVVKDTEGKSIFYEGSLEDITERRNSQVALEESEKRFRSLSDASKEGIAIVDEGRVVDVNRKMAEMLGYDVEEMIGRQVQSFVAPESINTVQQHIATGSAEPYEHLALRKDGTVFPVEAQGSHISMNGKPMRVTGLRDLTKQKRAEQALKESETRYRSLFESARDAIFVMNGETFVECNPATVEIFGCQREHIIGSSPLAFSPERQPDGGLSRELAVEKITAVLRGQPQRFEWKHKKPNGELFDADVSLNPLDTAGGTLLQAIVRDITHKKQAEKTLAESEEPYRRLVSTIPDAIIRTDLKGDILFTNDIEIGIGGYANTKELVGRNIFTFIAPEDVERAKMNARQILEEQMGSREYRLILGDGASVDCEITGGVLRDVRGRPYGMVYVLRDISERKRSERENKQLEEQLLRSQRMESIGTLAGGIAHDLNNVLGPILLVLEVLRRKHPDMPTQKLLQTVEASAKRGSELVKQVLSFGRGVQGERSIIQVRHLVNEIQKIIKETFPKAITLSSHIPKDLWTIQADPTQVHQVIMNICVNARDAMPRGGRLNIVAENILIDEQFSQMHIEAKVGKYMAITISDNGSGIAPESLGRIFEPFFTTKEIGKGTGLGLSTVLAIVKSHKGFIDVTSELRQGSTFKVFFPASDLNGTQMPTTEESEFPRGKGGLVLVVDDEAGIREVTKETLETFGYRVLTAADGAEAIARYAEKKNEIVAIITDIVMPFMDGLSTIRAIHRMNPQARILAVSGLPHENHIIVSDPSGVVKFLQKPYTSQKLLMALRNLIHEPLQGEHS